MAGCRREGNLRGQYSVESLDRRVVFQITARKLFGRRRQARFDIGSTTVVAILTTAPEKELLFAIEHEMAKNSAIHGLGRTTSGANQNSVHWHPDCDLSDSNRT